MEAKRFQDLLVYKKAHGFVLEVYRITKQFPREELFGLISQLRRAAVSIAANIAEGFAKRTTPDKLRFYNISQGSIEECRYYLILSQDLCYASTSEAMASLEEVSRMMTAYVRAIRR